ncbi:hypothetical protein GOODEAATRI_024668 [Goodea atripinnis]|uniref:Recombination activating protein 2 n=1 Tax=Goodea atripinnis TaxID=208336 RepID=A0ABV0P7J4_9TELE
MLSSKLFSSCSPRCQPLHLVPIGTLIPPGDKPHHCGVICKLDSGVVVSGGSIIDVEGVEGVEQGAQHLTLWRDGAEVEGRRCILTQFYGSSLELVWITYNLH